MRGPLDGIVVLDLTRALAGPHATMMLGDLGARVIKIEQPGTGDESRRWGPPFAAADSTYFLSCNRNKESVTSGGWPPAATCWWRISAPGCLTGWGSPASGCTS